MKKMICVLSLALLSLQAFAVQTISCSGQGGQSIIEITLSAENNTLTYEWDGAEKEDIETQNLIESYSNENVKKYETTNGTYLFEVQIPKFVLNKKAAGFHIIVKSDLYDSRDDEIFEDCVSKIR